MSAVRIWRLILIGFVTFLAIGPRGLPVRAGTVPYQVTSLGTLGGPTSSGLAINNQGQIAGVADLPGGKTYHGVVWQAQTMTNVGALGGPDSVVLVINNLGEAAGTADVAKAGDGTAHFCEGPVNACHAVLWKNGVLHDLGTLGGLSSQAIGINDLGQVVGNSETSTYGQGSPFLWENGKMKVLGGPISRYDTAGASAINDKGQVVGIFATPDNTSHHVYLWYKNKMTDLGVGDGIASDAFSINNHGQVVGGIVMADNVTTHAFEWRNGAIHYLPTYAGDSASFSYTINDAGVSVGYSYKGQTFSRAVLWRAGKVIDLNTLIPAGSGWHLDWAQGINAQGRIVGQGTFHGKKRGFLLTPVQSQ